jgi:hypothetical protein
VDKKQNKIRDTKGTETEKTKPFLGIRRFFARKLKK